MTDRLRGFIVTLGTDLREDDAEQIRQAILALRHVVAVDPVQANIESRISENRVREEIGSKLFEVVYPDGR